MIESGSIMEGSKSIKIKEVFEDNQELIALKMVAGFNGLDREVRSSYINRPAFVLIGYTEHFPASSLQVLGNREMNFLKKLKKKEREEAIDRLLSFSVPCVIITRGYKPFDYLKKECNRLDIPLFTAPGNTHDIQKTLHFYLEDKLAPEKVIHGTLVDVYGIGLLFTGVSGIGKSEAALDLVARGHRLVADDVVRVKRRGNILIGEGVEPSEIFKHHMEIRGIGIVNIGLLYGIRALRLHKRVEVVVNLREWNAEVDYTRTGLETSMTSMLGIDLPLVEIPLVPGKNIATLCELVAMNHILKEMGIDTAKILNSELIKLMKKQAKKITRLEEDRE